MQRIPLTHHKHVFSEHISVSSILLTLHNTHKINPERSCACVLRNCLFLLYPHYFTLHIVNSTEWRTILIKFRLQLFYSSSIYVHRYHTYFKIQFHKPMPTQASVTLIRTIKAIKTNQF